jgi:hypothetical protein
MKTKDIIANENSSEVFSHDYLEIVDRFAKSRAKLKNSLKLGLLQVECFLQMLIL